MDIVKYFWKGLRPQKWLFFIILLGISISNVLSLITPLYYKDLFDLLGSNKDKASIVNELTKILLIIVSINLSTWFIRRSTIYGVISTASNTMARIKQMSFDYMLHHSYTFFSNNFGGSLVQKVGRFAGSFDRLQETLVFSLIPLVIQSVGVIYIVWFKEPVISYIIGAWAIIVMIISYVFSKWKLKYDLEAAEADSATTAHLDDAITNQNTVSSFSGFKRESETFKKVTGEQSKIQRFKWGLSNTMDAAQGLLIVIVEFVLFYYLIRFWAQGAVTIGTFVLLQSYVMSLANKLWDFSRIVRNIYEGFADSKEMVEVLMTPYDIKDLPSAKDIDVKEGNIEFRDVYFNFNETRTVVDKLNVTINKGEKVALIGSSGAGKSTIVKLIGRTYDVTEGQIFIDGQDIKEVTQESLHKNISLVPQDPVLFHRTLMENIRYGKFEATDEEVYKASKLAHCDDFIKSLPLGYNTLVGERGIKLSGGERQRIAIARAILKNAPILILDEATSSLDSHSESLIQDALNTLMRGKTSIVIAHRLSTIRKMDRILVIEEGKVLEDGSHDELIKKENGRYRKLWELQAGGFLTEQSEE